MRIISKEQMVRELGLAGIHPVSPRGAGILFGQQSLETSDGRVLAVPGYREDEDDDTPTTAQVRDLGDRVVAILEAERGGDPSTVSDYQPPAANIDLRPRAPGGKDLGDHVVELLERERAGA